MEEVRYTIRRRLPWGPGAAASKVHMIDRKENSVNDQKKCIYRGVDMATT